jgi:2OG-Fe(II) oxygenase superfamily
MAAATAIVSPGELANVIANRRWLISNDPFPHLLVENVFAEVLCARMNEAFAQILSRGLSEGHRADRFSRISGYDAYAFPFTAALKGPLALFTSRGWHDLLAAVTGVNATGDIRGGLHHHQPGSAHGTVHNDLNPAYFAGVSHPDRVVFPEPDKCSYHYGTVSGPEIHLRRLVRAVAVIYYLNNPPWTDADGGETGLFGVSGCIERPAKKAGPINNSMLIFECTPVSWHAFLSNRRHPRNSVIMWLHRPYAEAATRWGEAKIVKW